MNVEVVGVGAWCDIDERAMEPGPETDGRTLHFRIEEFASLSDGRRLTLSDDRGWSSRMSGPGADADPWAGMTAEMVEISARTAVLPDDAEQTGDRWSWEQLAKKLITLGFKIAREEFKELPYDVLLSRRIQLLLK